MYRWIRLDVDALEHPKVMGVPPLARLLYIACLSYAQKHKTDGVIGKAGMKVALFLSDADPGMFDDLVEARLLEREGEVFRIHDYLKYQPSAEEMEERAEQISQARAEAGRRGGFATAANRSKRSKNQEDLLEANEPLPPANDASKPSKPPARNVHDTIRNDNDRLTMPLAASSSITGARAREPTPSADPPFEINGHDPVVLAVMQAFSLRLSENGYKSMMSMLQGHQSLSKQWITEAMACYGDYSKRGEHINNAAALFDRWLKNVEIGRSPPTATRDSLEADKWARNAQDPVVIRHQQANEERRRKREEAKRAEAERSGGATEGEAGRGAAQKPRAP